MTLLHSDKYISCRQSLCSDPRGREMYDPGWIIQRPSSSTMCPHPSIMSPWTRFEQRFLWSIKISSAPSLLHRAGGVYFATCLIYYLVYVVQMTTNVKLHLYCIVFVFNGIFRRRYKYNSNITTIHLYCICIWRNIPVRKINTTQTLTINVHCICIGQNIPAGKFRPESECNTYTTINVYCICIWRNIPAGK